MIGRCARTGRLGIGTATRSLAVGARVTHARAGLGAVAIMAIADARLGYMALRLLELGHKAPGVIDELVKGDPYAEYRQLGVIDADGFAAARTCSMPWSPPSQRIRPRISRSVLCARSRRDAPLLDWLRDRSPR